MGDTSPSTTYYNICPVGKPRMNRSAKWKRTPAIRRFFEFRDLVKLAGVRVPHWYCHITFFLPMPKSWSSAKREKMRLKYHQQKPDKDNLEKALLDSVYDEDCAVCDSRISKRWFDVGMIKVVIHEQDSKDH